MTFNESRDVAAIVLAAGKSERFGQTNKLLATYSGQTVLARSLSAVGNSGVSPILVVTGFDHERVTFEASRFDVEIVRNADFEHGMGTSIACGLRALPDAALGVLICLADMVFVTPRNIALLLESFASDPLCIHVPTYRGQMGNPVLWPNRFFGELGCLEGDSGGRTILSRCKNDVVPVIMPDDGVLRDIDTASDFERQQDLPLRHRSRKLGPRFRPG